ncbi:MAG: DUF1460 domain-containing protein [Chlorobi bacterium]|nr:DUF1460 domain-containing protein [Chlorobiota bacterium]
MRYVIIGVLHCTILSTTAAIAGSADSSSIAYNCALITAQRWHEKTFGALVAMVAQLFIGKPYVAGTLDTSSVEQCRFTADGFDCVTLVESALALARVAERRECTYERFLHELQRIRYRGGKLDGYLSRLHYTSEWISDNYSKGIVENITDRVGGQPIRKTLDFMSTHPHLYRQLRDSSALVPRLALIERRLSRRPLYIVPTARITAASAKIQSGDIIAIATSKPGLDYTHVGIALRSQGKLGLIHASSKSGKVFFEQSLEDYVRSYPNAIGITVARPLASPVTPSR